MAELEILRKCIFLITLSNEMLKPRTPCQYRISDLPQDTLVLVIALREGFGWQEVEEGGEPGGQPGIQEVKGKGKIRPFHICSLFLKWVRIRGIIYKRNTSLL